MSGRNDEQWMKERYEEVCRKNPEEYALISLKIKRFRIFNRLFGREAGDWLAGQVYEAIRTWLGEDEYVAISGWAILTCWSICRKIMMRFSSTLSN